MAASGRRSDAYENESSLGTETAQKYAKVLVPFMDFHRCVL
jgi:hypothetical protein